MKIYSVGNDINFQGKQRAIIEKVAKPIIEESKEEVVKSTLKFTPAKMVIKNTFKKFGNNILDSISNIKDNIADCYWNNPGFEVACVILGLISFFGGGVATGVYLSLKNEDKPLKEVLTKYATMPNTAEGTTVTEEEKAYISDSMQYFEDITNGKTWQRVKYSRYVQHFSQPKSDGGLEITDKEKENIEYMIENKINLKKY